MKNKGFTLIELIATITVLLAILALIVPNVFKHLQKSENAIKKEQINAIINIAKLYTNENTNILPEENDLNILSLQELKQSGLIKTEQILNPKTKKELQGCIIIRNENNKIGYEYTEKSTWCKRPKVTTTGDGLYRAQGEPGRFVYRGANPDNYIWLDENGDGTNQTQETYRIISYEPDGTVKVVRNERILKPDGTEGGIEWDEKESDTTGPRHNQNNTYCNYNATSENPYTGCNVWGNTSNTYYKEKTLSNLNQNFYFWYYPTDTSSLQKKEESGTVTQNSTLNNYLNETWYNSLTFKNDIVDHEFNVGSIYYNNEYAANDKGLIKEKQEEKVYTWIGKIGLINITEYIESSTNTTCTSVWSNYKYNPANTAYLTNNNWTCKIENYNYKDEYPQWSLTSNTNNFSSVWVIYTTGYLDKFAARYTASIRPAFYLKSDIQFTGSGTQADPYKIK